MKFNPTWPQVALVAVLVASVIMAHIWAPLAVSAVTSIVSTIVGALFVNLQKEDGEKGVFPSTLPPAPPAPPPTLGPKS